MPSYDSFMCPNCEDHFRVIWPECLPGYYHLCSKIKIKCPDCQEVTEVYDFLIDRHVRSAAQMQEVITGTWSGHAGRQDTGQLTGQ